MMDNPDMIAVSVIIPVYNAEKYLRDCLEGVINQTLTSLEIICVDDGSADGTAKILEEYQKKDRRIQVIRQENSGAGVARNTGMAAAKGEYLSFLDADDKFEKDMLQAAYESIKTHEADICAFAADSFDANTGESASYNAAFNKRYIPETDPFDPSAEGFRETVLQMFNGVPWNKMFKSSFIRTTGLRFQPLRTTNDAYFVYTALCKAKRIATLDRILIHRRKNDANSLTQTRDRSCLCFYEALKAIQDTLKESGIYGTFERTFINRALQNILWNAETVSPENTARIAEQMQKTGFRELGLDRHDADYFYDRRLYERYCLMRDLDPGAFRKALEESKERERQERENNKAGNNSQSSQGSAPQQVAERIKSLFRKKK